MYIQPQMETMVLPKDVLMTDPNPASGGSFPGGFPSNPAPARRAPALGNDSVQVF